MKICYQCLLVDNINIQQPQMLTAYRGCDKCKKEKVASYDLESVNKQIYILRKFK